MARPIFVAAGGLAVAAAVAMLVIGQRPPVYLPANSLDITRILPPPPVTGDTRASADRSIFRTTRHWLGTPRGDLAIRDVRTDSAAMADAFGCSLGVKLTPATAPKTIWLIDRATATADAQSEVAKTHFKRLRPYQVDGDASLKTCQPADQLKGSFDYPSGHATRGWTWALILASLAPDRATELLTRGRVYGDSRIVCGAHNFSAVVAGRATASATFAAERKLPAFREDLAAAKAELDALRADPTTPRPERCDAEAGLLNIRIL